jgi:hypothetical protein
MHLLKNYVSITKYKFFLIINNCHKIIYLKKINKILVLLIFLKIERTYYFLK